LADIISDLLKATTPFFLEGRKSLLRRAKVDFTALENAKLAVRNLAERAGRDFEPDQHGYPHFYFIDDTPSGKWAVFELGGRRVREFLNFALSCDVESLKPGQSQATRLYTPQGAVDGVLTCVETRLFNLSLMAEKAGLGAAWLRDLSDGYVAFDDDPLRKLPGPVWVTETRAKAPTLPEG
jgi:glycine hydroxymethyltransferase